MCETNVTTNFYYVDICKHEHEKLWCKIVPKIDVGQIEGNEGSHFYLFLFENLVQKSFQGRFYVCIK
jgi:hypothetical protein